MSYHRTVRPVTNQQFVAPERYVQLIGSDQVDWDLYQQQRFEGAPAQTALAVARRARRPSIFDWEDEGWRNGLIQSAEGSKLGLDWRVELHIEEDWPLHHDLGEYTASLSEAAMATRVYGRIERKVHGQLVPTWVRPRWIVVRSHEEEESRNRNSRARTAQERHLFRHTKAKARIAEKRERSYPFDDPDVRPSWRRDCDRAPFFIPGPGCGDYRSHRTAWTETGVSRADAHALALWAIRDDEKIREDLGDSQWVRFYTHIEVTGPLGSSAEDSHSGYELEWLGGPEFADVEDQLVEDVNEVIRTCIADARERQRKAAGDEWALMARMGREAE